MIIDTHLDVPHRLKGNLEDISVRTEGGDFDYPRAKAGGLDVPFMSIYVPAESQETGTEREIADELIDMVWKFPADWPDKFAVATSVSDVEAQFAEGKVSLAMGIENGAAIEGDLDNLEHFYYRGVRYMTLTHSKANRIADSSFDAERRWNGLSDFGREVVVAMNLIGMLVDVSHVSDRAFYQTLEISQAPIIASHSCCRRFTPGYERNVDDEMIKALAAKGGVVCIAFVSSFLGEEFREAEEEYWAYVEENDIDFSSKEDRERSRKFREEKGIGFADVSDVAEHIDHVIQLVGVDHVGLGSDFDGAGDSLPTGLKDVSFYPNLIFELLARGYSEEDIAKICSGNLLRVWSEVERVASKLQAIE